MRAMEEIRDIEPEPPPRSVEVGFQRLNHLGRVFQQCDKALQARARNIREGNAIVLRWDSELIDRGDRRLEPSSETIDDSNRDDAENVDG